MIVIPPPLQLVLASGSPRRRELLERAGLTFAVRPADIDETPADDEAPLPYVRRLAIEKAAAAMESPLAGSSDIVIAADTTVDVAGTILGKPLDEDDAWAMLRRLSGRSHQIHTGVAVSWSEPGARRSLAVTGTTDVSMVELSDDMIEWYLSTDDWQDKAGAYAIQGSAAAFVQRVEGSVTNVIGLPMPETLELIATAVRSAT